MTAGRDRDRGAATLWAVGAIAAALAVVTVVITVGVATVARHRAAAAADLAALAGATRAQAGQVAACAAAGWVVDNMGATLRSCQLRGPGVSVVVAVRPAGLAGVIGPAIGRARAGPALSGDAARATVDSVR